MHHHIYRELIAAIGGLLFIIIGITRQRERMRLIRSGKKAEGAMVCIILVIAGVCLLIFALGLFIYESGRNHG
ncbi:hypothetical protein [Mucilaginibacter ginsenosidivorans]|uniref:Uncharacterized protein n=1 Tax=Mucilaginibacter ginsenosidivorans TaxID=398053 RepID=A0A5B8V1Z5_9SPHI|nr:hypothetical protein [Mucilaginibacter ginsenosidivorans]QEC64681.1 hypothetical protein FRZ54_19630 [Mucilaginibacter ginsenosidivorans]